MPRNELIQTRRGTAAAWTAANPVLAAGEPGFETDTGNFKIGDGVTAWASLKATGSGTSSDVVRQIAVSNVTGDAAAITAAITAGTSGGKVDGKWATQQGKYARISSPTTISLGYSNTQAGNWTSDVTTEKVKLSLDILPDAGLGAALTIKGGYGTELDINVLGGGARGTVTDAATSARTLSADGTISLSAPTSFSSASGAFTGADVNATITIPGAGSSGATFYSKIVTVVDSTHVTLSDSATTAVTTAAAVIGSLTISSPNAIAAGLQPGAVVFITGAGPSPEGQTQPLAASVRTVNSGAGTFTVSEAAWAVVSGATMNWFDVAVRLEDCVGLKLNIYGKGYQGYLLAADAADDTSKRLRSCMFEKIVQNSGGGTLFWKAIEAFGSLGSIMSNTTYGDYIGQCADHRWDHYEGGVSLPPSLLARAYIWFDRTTAVNDLSISVGDRATEADILMTGGSGFQPDVGRFSQIRCTNYMSQSTGTVTSGTNTVTSVVNSALTVRLGQTLIGAGIPDGAIVTALSANGPGSTGNGWTAGSPGTITFSGSAATATASSLALFGQTSDGIKMVGVASVTIGKVDTARCVAGIRIVGGGGNGIKVLSHKSLSSDLSPLVIQPGATGLTPRVEVNMDYRFHLGYSVDIKSGLGAADIRLPGYIEGMHQVYGSSGRYAIRCASSTVKVDVSGLRQLARSGLLGVIDTTTAAVVGRGRARLENEVPTKGSIWYEDGAGAQLKAAAGSTGTVPVIQGDGTIAFATPPGADPAGYINPSFHSLTAWSVDPPLLTSAAAPPSGSTFAMLTAVPIPVGFTANNIHVVPVSVASTVFTSGQCFAALVDSGGVVLGVTADLSTTLATITANDALALPLTGPVSLSAGFVYVYFCVNYTGTAPTYYNQNGGSNITVNLKLGGTGKYRSAVAVDARTAAPSGTLAMSSSHWTRAQKILGVGIS